MVRPRSLALVLAMTLAASAVSIASTTITPSAAADTPPGGHFTDDDGNPHEPAIEAIRAEGITTGCTPTRYCPHEPVTRGQMAAFLNRALHLPPATQPSGFTDTTGTFRDDIERLKAAAITTGTSPTTYSPHRPVTRAEMATFLTRALHLDTPTTPPAPGRTDPNDEPARAEGSVGVLAVANSAFNPYTSGGHWSAIRANYEALRVYVPYWHSRLDHFDSVFAYRVSYGMSVDPAVDSRPVDHPEWILRETNGDPTYIDFDCSNGCVRYAADIGNPAFLADTIAWVRDLRDRGYPGIMLDDVNFAWRISDRDGNPVHPIDPRTGGTLTLSAWQKYFAEFLEAIRAAVPDMEIMHNVIWYADAPTFENPYIDRQIAAADVLQLERGANDRGLVGGDGKFSIGNFFRFIDRAHRHGADVLLLDENAVDEAGQWYNLAATLLVNEGGDLVSTEDLDFIAPDRYWSGFDTDLGIALGPREEDDGLFRREFSGGLVLLNEPNGPTRTVMLPAAMHNADGVLVTSVTLGSRRAAVLTTP